MLPVSVVDLPGWDFCRQTVTMTNQLVNMLCQTVFMSNQVVHLCRQLVSLT